MKWSELIWGRPAAVIASVGLALAAFWEASIWVVLCSVFIVVHAFVGWVRERGVVWRLGANYRDVLRRVLHLLSDLGNLSANGYDLWMIEVYLPKYVWVGMAANWRPGLQRALVRELSVSVGGASEPPHKFALTHQLFGRCFRRGRSELWWDRSLTDSSLNGVNSPAELDEKTYTELERTFGVVSVHPIVDAVGKDCEGLIVIHVGRDSEAATKVLGALTQQEGRRRILGACNDIHSYIKRRELL